MALSAAEYRQLDATGLAELIRRREVSAAEVLDTALGEIERLQPVLNALVWQDFERARSSVNGIGGDHPFAGVPLLLKDVSPHHLAGAPTADGCAVYRDRVMPANSHLVQNLIDAGFIIPGKTNIPEFALKGTTEPKAFGPARNPWQTEHTPGGSSGGSAAAVAAGMVPVATASDGGGSIRIPAAYCGLFGLKPSRGRVSHGPQQAEGWNGLSCDHVLTRTVRDSAAILDLLAGARPGDPYGIAPPGETFARAMQAPPGKLRIAFSTRSPLGTEVHPDHTRAVQETAQHLRALGHDVEEAEPAIDGYRLAQCYFMVYFGHVGAELDNIRRQYGDNAVRDVETESRVFDLLGHTYPVADYVTHQMSWNDFARTMGEFFGQYDLYMTPTTAQPPARLGEQDMSALERVGSRAIATLRLGRLLRASGMVTRLAVDALARVPFTQLANFCGTPAMSVPMGRCLEDSLPCGVQFIASRGEEALLLRLAHQLEQSVEWRTLADI